MAVAPSPASPRQNHLLDVLPESEYEHLCRHLELVRLPLGMALYESGEGLSHVYFP
ncbi:Crp/Fnr family transcriptional regulator, partial [Thiorhodococcus minor]|nr:Crp/Fnr family transcriptional regulator [Thiorhodococcus minor]